MRIHALDSWAIRMHMTEYAERFKLKSFPTTRKTVISSNYTNTYNVKNVKVRNTVCHFLKRPQRFRFDFEFSKRLDAIYLMYWHGRPVWAVIGTIRGGLDRSNHPWSFATRHRPYVGHFSILKYVAKVHVHNRGFRQLEFTTLTICTV